MKRTKKILVGLLATLSVLSGSLGLVACGGNDSSSSSNGSNVEQSSDSNVSSDEESSSDDENSSNDENSSDEDGSNDEGIKNFSQGLEYTLLDGDTYEVTGIGDCMDTEIIIPSSYNGKAVTSIGDYAFDYCDSLTSIEIPDSVTSIGKEAFFYCSSLTSIEIPDSVTSIADYAFDYCDSLTSVYITDIEAWCNISGLANLMTVASSNKNLYLNNELVTELEIPNTVTEIKAYAFYNCDSLTSVVIGDSVTSIGYDAFAWCDNLTSIEIPDSVTSIGGKAFSDCDSLTSIVIPDSVTSIGDNAFAYCYRLVEVVNKSTYITIEKGSSANGLVGRYALAVYNSGDEFTGTKLSNDNGYIVYTDGEEKILVDYTGTKTDLTLPSYITKINQYAFYNCDSLTSVTIPDSVTSIGSSAFYDCSSLTSIVIGDSVTSIGEEAFYACKSLTGITFNGTKAQWKAIETGYNWIDNVPAKKVVCSDGE